MYEYESVKAHSLCHARIMFQHLPLMSVFKVHLLQDPGLTAIIHTLHSTHALCVCVCVCVQAEHTQFWSL